LALSGQFSFAGFCPLSDHSGQGRILVGEVGCLTAGHALDQLYVVPTAGR
jgi:hypothetical protein